jgi:serine phosphatase RsbU (regulator of sigma subunit)
MYMNYSITRNLKNVVTLLVFAALLAACAGNGKASKDEMSRNDSIIFALYEKGDYDRVEAVMDSMEQLGVVPVWSVASIRAGIHGLTDHDLRKIDGILKEALTHQDMKTDLDSLRYTECMVKYGYILLGQNKMEETLRMVMPTLEQMKQKVKHPEYGTRYMSLLIKCYDQLMCTQFYLGMKDDSKKTCEELYQCHFEQLKRDSSSSVKFQFACELDHMSEILFTYKDYATAEKYVRCLDSLSNDFLKKADANEIYIDEVKAMRSLACSKYELGIGNRAEADKYFAEFLKTDYSKKGVAPFNIAAYLLEAGRYAEAADKYALLDQYLANAGADFDFNYAPQFCEKFKANYLAGRRDSALAVAKRVFDSLDSLITADRQSNAIEMATVYETQKKDAEIAKQQIELTQQRVIGLIIAIALLTVFFIVYTLIRKRAAKKLADMKAAQERIESELRIARDIQMSMVPREFPQREGLDMFASMTPAKEVGGDLYGYEIVNDKLYFCVGDVSGKGVPASLFMAQVTRLFQTMARQGLMPADICSQMNDALSGKDNEEGMFVTFWLGLLDMQTGHLNFCNAGHNPPIIGGGDNQGDFMEMQPNAPIGLFPGLEYEGEEIESVKGRALFIYTDGLNEAENTLQEQFGDERLLGILRDTHFDSAQQVIESLKVEVEQHRNGAEPNDDLTMMCLRIN